MADFPNFNLSSIAAWNASQNDHNDNTAPSQSAQGQYLPTQLSLPNGAVPSSQQTPQQSVHVPKHGVKRKRKEPNDNVGDGKHDCPVCGQGNQSEANLKVHVREKHTMDRPWYCTICFQLGNSAGYARHFSAKRHIKLSHGKSDEVADSLVGEHKTLADKSLADLINGASTTAPNASSRRKVQRQDHGSLMPASGTMHQRPMTPASGPSPAQSFALANPTMPCMPGHINWPSAPVAPPLLGSSGLSAPTVQSILAGFGLPSAPSLPVSIDVPALPQVSEQPATLSQCQDCGDYFESRDEMLQHGHTLPHLKPPSIDCDCSICEVIYGGDLILEPAMTSPEFDGPDWQWYLVSMDTDEIVAQEQELLEAVLPNT